MYSAVSSLQRLYNHLQWEEKPGKVTVGVVRDCRKFSGHSDIGLIARLSLRKLSFLVQICSSMHYIIYYYLSPEALA